ncbi:MAG: thioredoxin-disulfide reductase [Planctomycetes bacterium]|nr:thioredoxin-disulfide reductase [Planctomycetota bacterium]
MTEKVVIIGSGPSGWTAAIYAARANLEPLVFEGLSNDENMSVGRPPLGQLFLTTEVENFPGFPFGRLESFLDSAIGKELSYLRSPTPKDDEHHAVTGPDLMLLMKQQAINFGTRIKAEDIVDVHFDSSPFRLITNSGESVVCHSVIIATGARANYLGLESEAKFKNQGVSACAVCDGALPRFRNKPLVVVGGGDSAVEEADYLSKFASRVYMVHRRDALRASKIMQQRALNNPKIEVVWNHGLVEVLGDDKQGVTHARLENTVDKSEKKVDASGVFLAIGHTPNTAFLKGKLQMNPKGYLVWTKPQRTYTSVEGVFAAGDVADDYYRQAITAAGTGCMAALDAERYLAAKGL